MTYPHGEIYQEELCKTEKMIKNHRHWIQGALSDIGDVLKLKKDYQYYIHLVSQLESRINAMEFRLDSFKDN